MTCQILTDDSQKIVICSNFHAAQGDMALTNLRWGGRRCCCRFRTTLHCLVSLSLSLLGLGTDCSDSPESTIIVSLSLSWLGWLTFVCCLPTVHQSVLGLSPCFLTKVSFWTGTNIIHDSHHNTFNDEISDITHHPFKTSLINHDRQCLRHHSIDAHSRFLPHAICDIALWGQLTSQHSQQ